MDTNALSEYWLASTVLVVERFSVPIVLEQLATLTTMDIVYTVVSKFFTYTTNGRRGTNCGQ